MAQAKGWYAAAGLEVHLLSPHDDGYATTPSSRLADGTATFACVPSESVISHATWPGGAKPRLVAVAALLQGSQSAIVALASSGIDRPAKLDGKRYASYAARCGAAPAHAPLCTCCARLMRASAGCPLACTALRAASCRR